MAGSAHCEPALADYIAERTDWHCSMLEMGPRLAGLLAQSG